MAKAREFMISYSLCNKVWFESGINAASPTNTGRLTAKDITAFPKVTLQQVQNVWQSKGADFQVD
jgi:hypothetical protein